MIAMLSVLDKASFGMDFTMSNFVPKEKANRTKIHVGWPGNCAKKKGKHLLAINP